MRLMLVLSALLVAGCTNDPYQRARLQQAFGAMAAAGAAQPVAPAPMHCVSNPTPWGTYNTTCY